MGLFLAEQKLIEAGTKPEELRKLCDVHLELIQMEAEELKGKLTAGHQNSILYPSAFQELRGDEIWDTIKEKCDQIGYCPFTPNINW